MLSGEGIWVPSLELEGVPTAEIVAGVEDGDAPIDRVDDADAVALGVALEETEVDDVLVGVAVAAVGANARL